MRNFSPLVLNSNDAFMLSSRLSLNSLVINGMGSSNDPVPTGQHQCPGTGTASYASNCLTCGCPVVSVDFCPTASCPGRCYGYAGAGCAAYA